ncbi:Protein encore [Eumeta japonica]|uniref:Protein encore n=1 Tax=Eumeta variegata TaxID=151549 RepID=A0A4C1V6G1_EUMVA|nr:Protein encore [Eumeta japonica]
MEQSEADKGHSSPEDVHLNRNRSFKSKQLVRSQAIRESQSPPRTHSPAASPAAPLPAEACDLDADEHRPGADVHDAAIDVHGSLTDVQNSIADVRNSVTDAQSPITVDDVDTNDIRTVSDVNDSGNILIERASAEYGDEEKYDADEVKRLQQVEIQITSGGWDEPSSEQRQRTRRWLGHRQRSGSGSGSASHDLLSNSPRVTCVCGSCAPAGCRRICPDCRNSGNRRRGTCPAKQDSGIGCSGECPDCADGDNGTSGDSTEKAPRPRKPDSLDVEHADVYAVCRCSDRDRKDRPKSVTLSRTDSGELATADYAKNAKLHDKCEPTGAELVSFIKDTLNKNPRDRLTLLKIERELYALVNDTGRCVVRFPVMTSYGRMLVHRCAALFQLAHHLDHNNKGSVLVSKSGTSGGRIPCMAFRDWCTADFPAVAHTHTDHATQAKSILKRDVHSLDEVCGGGAGGVAGCGAGGGSGGDGNGARSKSLEQRERDYERVRRRIFREDESQWWLGAGPVRLLAAAPDAPRNKLVKVQSLETNGSGSECSGARGAPVSKSHSFGGYGREPPHPATHAPPQPRMLSRQGEVAWGSWRISPSSSGYKTLSLRSTDSVTPSPTGGVSPEPCVAHGGEGGPSGSLVWAVTDLSAVPLGALIIHPQTGRPLTNPDGSEYRYDPANPPQLFPYRHLPQHKTEASGEKRRGRLEKQNSFIESGECEYRGCCCGCRHAPDAGHCDGHPDQIVQIDEVKTNGTVLSHCKSHYGTNHEEPHSPGADCARRPGAAEGAASDTALVAYSAHSYDSTETVQQQPTQSPTAYAHDAHAKTAPVPPSAPAPHLSYPDPTIPLLPPPLTTTRPMPGAAYYEGAHVCAGPLSLSGMVYSAATGHTPYAYGPAPAPAPAVAQAIGPNAHCRMEQQIPTGVYPPHVAELEHRLAPPMHNPEPAFRIDQSYPYATQPIPEPPPPAPVGVFAPATLTSPYAYAHSVACAGAAACGVDPLTGTFHCITAPNRGVSMGYAASLEAGTALVPATYPLANVLVPPAPAPAHHYSYASALPWQAGMQPMLTTPTIPSNCTTPVQKSTPPPTMYLPQQELPLYHQPINYKQPELVSYSNQIYPVYSNFGYPQCVVPQMLPQYPVSFGSLLPAPDRRGGTPARRNSGVRSYESFQARKHEVQNSKKNSVNSSSRNTPLDVSYTPPDDRRNVPYDKKNTEYDRRNKQSRNNPAVSRQSSNELAAKIQQIKEQMAQLNVQRGGEAEAAGRPRPRNGAADGILGSCPADHCDGALSGGRYGRSEAEDAQLSSAALAIVDTIRSLQAKHTLQKDNIKKSQDYHQPRNHSPPPHRSGSRQHCTQAHDDSHAFASAPTDGQSENKASSNRIVLDEHSESNRERKSEAGDVVTDRRDADARLTAPLDARAHRDRRGHDAGPRAEPPIRPVHPTAPFTYRPYVIRQMAGGAWCRRSPGPLPLPPGKDARTGLARYYSLCKRARWGAAATARRAPRTSLAGRTHLDVGQRACARIRTDMRDDKPTLLLRITRLLG